MTDHANTNLVTTPGVATVEEGHVILDGPDGVAITMTAEAAVATGHSLVEAGEKARRWVAGGE